MHCTATKACTFATSAQLLTLQAGVAGFTFVQTSHFADGVVDQGCYYKNWCILLAASYSRPYCPCSTLHSQLQTVLASVSACELILFCLSVMSALRAYSQHKCVVTTGDLKLEGPVSTQVSLLLEENAALQVMNLNAVPCFDMSNMLNIKSHLLAARQPTGQLGFRSSMVEDASIVAFSRLHFGVL